MSSLPGLNADRWHDRFLEQAGWTKQVRHYVIEQLNLNSAGRMLEVGCGTGAVTSDFSTRLTAAVHGVDINFQFLRKALDSAYGSHYTCGDAYALPYPSGSFDACFCHFLLLWLEDPPAALKEMLRVVKKGGWVIVLAEPDYRSRIDYPEALEVLGEQQTQALESQGANPNIGRSSAHLLIEAGCRGVKSGLMGGQWGSRPDAQQMQSEWDVLRADLENRMPAQEIDELLALDRQAWQDGYRILFVPTFYAWGQAA